MPEHDRRTGFHYVEHPRKDLASYRMLHQCGDIEEEAASRLGNTKAVCRKAYIHPAIFAAYMDGRPMATDEAGVAAMIGGKRGRESFSSPAA